MSNDTPNLSGREAIEYAEQNGVTHLWCYANPVDDGGWVDIDRAREIAAEDPSLIELRGGWEQS